MTPEDLDRINRAEEIQLYTENRCKALEKENAELREKWLQATDEGTSWARLKNLENINTELKKNQEAVNMQLIQAKGFLKWFVWYFEEVRDGLVPCKDKLIEVEQFLRGLE